MNDSIKKIVISQEDLAKPVSQPVRDKVVIQLAPAPPAPSAVPGGSARSVGGAILATLLPFYNAWYWWRKSASNRQAQRLQRAFAFLLGIGQTASVAIATVAYANIPDEWTERLMAANERCVVKIENGQGFGTGFVVASRGNRHLIITNKHVVEVDPDYCVVTGRFTGACQARLAGLGKDKIDLALLVVELPGLQPVCSIASFESIRTGQRVMAIGHPVGLDFSLTDGVVSSKRAGVFVQTSTPINPGNSGGPLFNKEGSVVGVNTYIVEGRDGLGFATRADFVFDRERWDYFESIDDLLDLISH